MKGPRYSKQIKRVYEYITLRDIREIKRQGGILLMIKYLPKNGYGY